MLLFLLELPLWIMFFGAVWCIVYLFDFAMSVRSYNYRDPRGLGSERNHTILLAYNNIILDLAYEFNGDYEHDLEVRSQIDEWKQERHEWGKTVEWDGGYLVDRRGYI